MVGRINPVVVIVILAGAVILFLYFWMRDTPRNNLRWARKHHKLGEEYNSKGDHEEAKLHYEVAKNYREKALKGGD